MTYLDTSAAIKLVLPEQETQALELWIAERERAPRVSSRLLATAHEVLAGLMAFVCYDKRLCDSARAMDLPVQSPSGPS